MSRAKCTCRPCPDYADPMFWREDEESSCPFHSAAAIAEGVTVQEAKHEQDCTLGVGDGTGQLFVHGSHEAVKVCQSKLLELERLRARVAELERGLQAVEKLIAESGGVYGLHLNGDMAPWGELRSGGSFEEWLADFDAATCRARVTGGAT